MSDVASGDLRIVVVGLGYVGATAAACLTSQGHTVVGVDVNSEKVANLNAGVPPILEPQVTEFTEEAVAEGRLSAQSSIPELTDFDLVIVCVGTPSASDGSHNMTYIAESARQIAQAARGSRSEKLTVAFRSTFRPGTIENLIAPIFTDVLGEDFARTVELVYNPEFLRESTAVNDYFNPPKIVIGTGDANESPTMTKLNDGISAPVFITDYRSAEITKFVDNSWHAVKVAFANEVGRVAAAYKIDADVVHKIFVSDTKLNISPYYTRPGGAFGGSCLPKDVRAMSYIAKSAGVEAELIDSLIPSNETHKSFQFNRVQQEVRPGAKILVIGVAFKSGTDDMRESPNVALVASLIETGYEVKIYDPVVRASTLVGQNLGQVLTEIPTLRSTLLSAEEISSHTFDLVVLNHVMPTEIEVGAATVLDLRTVRPQDLARDA